MFKKKKTETNRKSQPSKLERFFKRRKKPEKNTTSNKNGSNGENSEKKAVKHPLFIG